jgi:hypothetical protein
MGIDLSEYRETAMQKYGDKVAAWGMLATGTDEALYRWALDVYADVLDRRACRDLYTDRCRLFVWPDTEARILERAIAVAKQGDVTLQLLCVHEAIPESAETHDLAGGGSVTIHQLRETYPVLHLASHGMRWGTEADSPVIPSVSSAVNPSPAP